MKLLRLFGFRILLIAGLFAALAVPPDTIAKTVTKSSTNKATHKTTSKKSSKKISKKTSKKPSPKAVIKPGRKIVPTPHKITASTGKYVSAAKDGVEVLANPSADAEVRWEIFEKYPLQVKKQQGDWLQVADFEGATGWIKGTLVTDDKSVIVCKKKINLRQDPNGDQNNPIIATVRYGVVFTPVEKKDDWLKVRYSDNTEGWLDKNLVWPSNPLD